LTLLSWLQEGRKTVAEDREHDSPLIGLEVHFVDIMLQMSSMRQPLTATGALSTINSLVETSNMKNEIIEWFFF
jgi:hypothetical protein